MKNLFKPKKEEKKDNSHKPKDSRNIEPIPPEQIQDWDLYNVGVSNTPTQPKKYFPENKPTQVKPAFVYQPTLSKKLNIILIENTNEVAKENDKLIKIIKNFVNDSDLVSIIHYGSETEKIQICEFSKLKDEDFCCSENIGENACLYDTLVEVEKFVSEKFMKVEEINSKKFKIESIDIIGIGRCFDNCSKNSKELGINSFAKISKNATKILTKYFCLTEEFFLEAAEVGFRSIGSISRNYQ